MLNFKTWKQASAIVLIMVFVLMVNVVSASQDEYSSLLDELLPSREDIPSNLRTGDYKNETLNEDGFLEGRSNSYNRLFEGYIIMTLRFRVYKFSDSESANSYYNKKVDEIKSTGGYTEVEIPSAFAVINENGVEIGNSWSVTNDIVWNVEVYNDSVLENTEDALVSYTLLELSIIPEFPAWAILPVLLIAGLAVILVKRKIPKKTNQEVAFLKI